MAFCTRTGEMSPISLAPAETWPLLTRNLDVRPPRFNLCRSLQGYQVKGAARPGLVRRGLAEASSLVSGYLPVVRTIRNRASPESMRS